MRRPKRACDRQAEVEHDGVVRLVGAEVVTFLAVRGARSTAQPASLRQSSLTTSTRTVGASWLLWLSANLDDAAGSGVGGDLAHRAVLAKPLDPIGRRLSPLDQLGIQRAAGIALIDPAEHLA